MNKIPSSTATIRFQDCDPFGHLNNSSYIDYLFNAREDQLINEYDLDIFGMAKTMGRSWMSAQSEIIYLKPAFVMEKVHMETMLINYSKDWVQAEMVMYDLHKTHVKAVLWGKFLHVDMKQNKKTDHLPEHMVLFERLHIPITEEKIDQRGFALARALKESQMGQKVT